MFFYEAVFTLGAGFMVSIRAVNPELGAEGSAELLGQRPELSKAVYFLSPFVAFVFFPQLGQVTSSIFDSESHS